MAGTGDVLGAGAARHHDRVFKNKIHLEQQFQLKEMNIFFGGEKRKMRRVYKWKKCSYHINGYPTTTPQQHTDDQY